jgi:hypothetical protein
MGQMSTMAPIPDIQTQMRQRQTTMAPDAAQARMGGYRPEAAQAGMRQMPAQAYGAMSGMGGGMGGGGGAMREMPPQAFGAMRGGAGDRQMPPQAFGGNGGMPAQAQGGGGPNGTLPPQAAFGQDVRAAAMNMRLDPGSMPGIIAALRAQTAQEDPQALSFASMPQAAAPAYTAPTLRTGGGAAPAMGARRG